MAVWGVALGKQNADEIPCYVFAVKPKKLEQGKRYFQGMVWVDDRDALIEEAAAAGRAEARAQIRAATPIRTRPLSELVSGRANHVIFPRL